MALLPICYQTPRTVLGHAIVDDDLFDILSERTWYCSNMRVAKPPRFSVELGIEGGGYQLTHFFLNRVVQASLVLDRPAFQAIWQDAGRLWNFIHELPRVKMVNGDPYDCRAHNITMAMKPETLRKRDKAGNPFSVPVLRTAEPSEQMPEPLMPASSEGIRLTEDYSALVIPAGTASRDAQKFLDMLGGLSPTEQTPVASPADQGPDHEADHLAQAETIAKQEAEPTDSVFDEGSGEPKLSSDSDGRADEVE